jgi:CxxC motif-containing protein (DUF1111 family)
MRRRARQWSWMPLPNWREVVADRRVLGAAAVLGLSAATWAALAPSQAELAANGQKLFMHEWTPHDPLSGGGDGLGPVFNAKSCVACHSQGGTGGAGDNQHNVVAYETLPTPIDDKTYGGVVHAAAVEGEAVETQARIRELHPLVKEGARVVGVCTTNLADLDPVVFHEINTPALFGTGKIDGISGWSIRNSNFTRRASNVAAELGGDFHRTPAGRVRILPDGRVGKFGWKAQFATLEEFVATACAVEVGLSNPYRPQDLPHEHRPDAEARPDMTSRQLDELVAYCALLEAPHRDVPSDAAGAQRVAHGEGLFSTVGCADCHVANLGGIEGVYSDFCLHSIVPPEQQAGYGSTPVVPLPLDLPTSDEWKTPPLWGVADTAPFMHDGSAPTLEAAIDAHAGEARYVMERYRALAANDREAVVAFLKSLRAPTQDTAAAP